MNTLLKNLYVDFLKVFQLYLRMGLKWGSISLCFIVTVILSACNVLSYTII